MKLFTFPTGRRSPLVIVVCLVSTCCLMAVTGCGGRHKRTKALESLSADDRTMLQQYEAMRSLLAQDDFRGVRRAATNLQKLQESGNPVAKSLNPEWISKMANANILEQQREAFRSWSGKVIALTGDVQGFYLIHCPLPKCGDWVQTTDKVENPYMGKAMINCGEVQK